MSRSRFRSTVKMLHYEVLLLCLFFYDVAASVREKPNIIVIIADDMGFNDVGFHGSDEIPTPNIDALAYNGVILNSHYTQALCTPSRAAFLTSKYPIHTGMQHLVILEPEPWGLPLNETLMPELLKKNGYATHAIGKWHLGFFEKQYTPTYRGFDSHFGFWNGYQDYYKHTVHATFSDEYGYDMRRNMEVDKVADDKYSTTLFTNEAVRLIRQHDTKKPMFLYMAHLAVHSGNSWDPLQAPDEEIAKFTYIDDPERRIYAAMVSMLDQSVGAVVAALREKQMLQNSVILFMSDNGAQPEGIHANHGSNYPFRGIKDTAWEGGQRNLAAIWSPLIKKPQRVTNHLMHITDWLPTFYSIAGLNKSELPAGIDGLDIWESISEDRESPRIEVLYNIDDISKSGAVRQGDWKYIYGSPSKGAKDKWFGDNGKRPQYNYDIDQILTSKAASAFTGLITYQQIKEKNQKSRRRRHTTPIDKSLIERLRKDATITCKKVNLEDQLEETKCNLIKSPCLFNIKDDPCEMVNLASARPNIVQNLEHLLLDYRKLMVKPRNVPRDPNANPKYWNNTWTNWNDCENIVKRNLRKMNVKKISPLGIGLIVTSSVMIIVMIIVLSRMSDAEKDRLRKIKSQVLLPGNNAV